MPPTNGKKYSPHKGKKPAGGEGFKEYLYNANDKTVLGRTWRSWGKIILFYVLFYAGLAQFFCLNFYIFYLTLNMDAPKLQLEESLIGTNPGLGFRPMPDPDKSADSTLIWFRRNVPSDYKFWSDQLTKFVDETDTGKEGAGSVNLQACHLGENKRATATTACKVKIENLEFCNKNNFFGYQRGEPCILIKLNKIYGWIPEPYGYDENDRFSEGRLLDDLDREVLEKRMPEDLKYHIMNQTRRLDPRNQNFDSTRKMLLSTVWINCDGENVADTENIGGIKYYPDRGIYGFYFPYLKQQGYQSPFIFVELKNPMPGVVINVECKAFAKNVRPDRLARLATTHFEILID